MYKILLDNELFTDSRVEELAILSPVVTLEANKAGSMTFIINADHPSYDKIVNRKSIFEVYFDEDMIECIFSGICINSVTNLYKQKTVTVEGELTYLNDSILRPQHYQGYTTRQLLESYVAQHNAQCGVDKSFQVGVISAIDKNDSITCFTNFDSAMSSIKEDLVDDIGGYILLRKASGVRYIDYYADAPKTCSQEIRLGDNLLDFKSNLDSTELATVVIPLGAALQTQTITGLDDYVNIKSVNDGKDYIESETAIANFGRIEKVVKFDDVNTPSILKTKGQKYLTEYQFENVSIEVNAIDLHLDDEHIEEFKLLNAVRIISEPHGLNKLFTITKMVYNLNEPEKNIITLGTSYKPTMSAKTAEVSATVDINKPSGLLDTAKRNASEMIKKGQNGFVSMETDENGNVTELLIMDTKDKATATKVWRWNSGGLGYSKNGYDGAYGLAMTMNGSIVADFITTGALSCDRLNGGAIKGQTISGNAISGGTISGTTISGTTISGGTISGGAISGGTINGTTISGGTISGTTINGSQLNASGVVRRHRSNYSSADVTRAQNITVGNVSPSISDYEKLDLNADGIINISDAVMIQKLINGDYGDYVDTTCPVVLNGSNDFGTIKTKDVAINNGGIITKNISVNGTLEIGGNIYAKDGVSRSLGATKTVNNPTSIRVVNGIVVSIN